MPKSVGYPYNLVSKKGPVQGAVIPDDQRDLLKFCMASIKLWCNTTQTAREKFRRDYQYAEGNGQQWLRSDRLKVQKQRRPALEFNQILPQVEMAAGIQRTSQMEYVAVPRGLEDKRLGEIVTASLKATSEYVRLPRKDAHVFDDGTICGMGVWRILHTMEDTQDVLWGDILVERINPMAFMWDPWASADEGFQDGAFMGDLTWVHLEDFKEKYPAFQGLANPGEWIQNAGNYIGDSSLLGVGDNLLNELYDQETGMIRLATLWYKKPTEVTLIVNGDTGQVTEADSKDAAQAQLAQMAAQIGQEAIAKYQVIQQGETTALQDSQTGQLESYASPEFAKQRLDQLSQAQGMEVYNRMGVITRKARVPHWVEMVWGQILEYGKTPYSDRKYPYVPYVSRQFQDDPESIMGIVRNLWDPQDEYNKRYSNLLAHSNSSAHSGWLNKKSAGANSSELERMGSTPGVVVEYASVAPSQIKPVELSMGHFNMIQHSGQQILRISGINAEMVGSTTQKTVSGRAIKARQEGGAVILKPRLFNFDEAKLDCSKILLSRIQQYYTPGKLKRIIGMWQLANPMMPGTNPTFADPITGQPMPDEAIFQMLTNLKNISFDLSLKKADIDPTVRQDAFERAVQLVTLYANTGRPVGPNTLMALTDLSDMPTRLEQAFKMDAMMPPQMPPQQDSSVVNAQSAKRGGHESDSGGPGPGGE